MFNTSINFAATFWLSNVKSTNTFWYINLITFLVVYSSSSAYYKAASPKHYFTNVFIMWVYTNIFMSDVSSFSEEAL